MSAQPMLLRYAGPDLSYGAKTWQERAACVGEDPSIFHVLSAEDPGCSDLSEVERKDLENSNFDKARKICSRCPVAEECGAEGRQRISAEAGQKTYLYNSFSVRGGTLPSMHTPRASGRPPRFVEGQPCPRGHDASRVYINGKRRVCRECERLKPRPSRRKKVDGEIPPPRVTLKQRHEAGELDHSFSPQGSAPWKCKVCESKKKRAQRSPSGEPETPTERHERRHGHAPRFSPTAQVKRCLTCARISNAKREKRLAV